VSARNPAESPAAEEHVVIFRLDREFYAIDIHSVQEIVRLQPITAIPGSDPWVEGITNLRGRVVPVVDLRRRCGIPESEHTSETRIVVVHCSAGTVGLIVDAVTEVLRIPASAIEPPNALSQSAANGYLRAVAKLPDRLVSLVNLDALLGLDEATAAAVDEAQEALDAAA
jgi:purine-binding chemotaxis protein CheW